VTGFGIAAVPPENNTMFLSPGETKEYKVELQNNDASELKIKFFLDSKIASVADEREYYVVGNKTPFVEITLLIKIPDTAKKGEIYTVKYAAQPFSSGDNSPISLNIRLSREFNVVVKETEIEKETKNYDSFPTFPIIIAIIIIFVILFILITRKNNLLRKRFLKK